MTTRAYPDIVELKTMLKLRKEMDEKKREVASLGFFGRKRKAALEREAAELQQKLLYAACRHSEPLRLRLKRNQAAAQMLSPT